jgi:hypothetical protein
VEAEQTGHARSYSDGERGSVPDPPAPRSPARLLDQRLEVIVRRGRKLNLRPTQSCGCVPSGHR